MKHRLIFSFKHDAKANKYIMIDPPLSEEQALQSEMVEELFIPCWRPRPMPQTISIILHFDVSKDSRT
ncbi:MAG: hypothetical protein WBB67_15505 [bacterium]